MFRVATVVHLCVFFIILDFFVYFINKVLSNIGFVGILMNK